MQTEGTLISLRRARLKTEPNPARKFDYLVGLTHGLDDGTRVEVRYVPDKRVLTEGAFADYVTAIGRDGAATIEAAAATLLDDLNNELVPRWIAVSVARGGHRVLCEDRQPNWDNPSLLDRLGGL